MIQSNVLQNPRAHMDPQLDLQSVKDLRLTSKALAELLAAALLKTFTFDINRYNFEERLAQLAELSTGNYATSTVTQELVIGSLSPVYDPKFHAWGKPENDFSPEVSAAREVEMKKYLTEAFTSFQAVHSVM